MGMVESAHAAAATTPHPTRRASADDASSDERPTQQDFFHVAAASCPPVHCLVLLALLLLCAHVSPAHAICPARCRCNDDLLQVSCARANLEVVPIQLNPEVRHVDIAHNRITNVIFTLTNYNNLITLSLAGNRLQSLDDGNFESQRHLTHLNVSGNLLTSLGHDSLRGLRAVRDLDLSLNSIEEVNARAFRDLHSLEVLRFAGNRLMTLDNGLLQPCSLLRELYVDDNQLVDMPGRALLGLYNLARITLSNNLIQSVTVRDMTDLPQLLHLRLDNNVLNDIEAGALASLSALEHLDLSDNNFTAVPTASLAKLANLTTLRFSGNMLRAVAPVAFRGLFQLRRLHLSRLDFLGTIDARAFVDNINLERVWLDDNIAVERLPTRLFFGNPRLHYLSVRNNRLTVLESSHFPLDQLTVLRIGGNPLVCNCTLLWLWGLTQAQHQRNAHIYLPNDTALVTWNTVGVTNVVPGTVAGAGAGAGGGAELNIDVDRVQCDGPEPVQRALLVDLAESQLGCFNGVLMAVSVASCVCVLLVLVSAGVRFAFSRKYQRCGGGSSLGGLRRDGLHLRSASDRTDRSSTAGGNNIAGGLIPDGPVYGGLNGMPFDGATLYAASQHRGQHQYVPVVAAGGGAAGGGGKFAIGTGLLHLEYRELPPWDACPSAPAPDCKRGEKLVDPLPAYDQAVTKRLAGQAKPHIVYV